MLQQIRRTTLPWIAGFCVTFTAVDSRPSALMADDKPTAAAARSEDVLTLLEEGVIDVEMVAHGAYRLDVKIWNLTKESVLVRFPPGLVADAFGQNEVLAQIRGGGGGGGSGSGSFGGGSGGSQGMGLIETPAIQVASTQPVFLSIRSVCLNFGLPEPNPRSPLFLKRIDEYTSNLKVRELLLKLAQAGAQPSVAQVALWHYTNGLSWEQLARIPLRATGRLSADDFQMARAFAEGRPMTEDTGAYADTIAAKDKSSKDDKAPVRRRSLETLTMQINPDPRGGNGAGVARAVASQFQKEIKGIDVTHANAAPKDDSSNAVVCWQVLVKAPTGRSIAAYGKPVSLTLVRCDWDAKKGQWKRDRPRVAKVLADDAQTVADVAAAVRRQLMNEIASQAVTVTYSAANRELTLTNTLPVAVSVREIKPRRDATKTAEFKDLVLAAHAKKTIPLDDRIPHEPGRALQPMVANISIEAGKS